MDVDHENEAQQPSVKRLGSAFAGLMQGHLELLGIELQEEKARAIKLFLLAGVSLVLGILILVGISAVVVMAFWDNRIAATIILCLLYAIALGVCLSMVMRIIKEFTQPFQATLEELARDRERLMP
ncbi:phage holin family protein [Stutzerimonas tarimensis]|uniref:Phage holin family protein n=1 Tax=Stutzerimonas tarimensis TaxID=1507735 RepID=A0ABV7T6E4_9GAMM